MLRASVKRISKSTNAIATPKRLPWEFRDGAAIGSGVTHATLRLAVYFASTSSTGSETARA